VVIKLSELYVIFSTEDIPSNSVWCSYLVAQMEAGLSPQHITPEPIKEPEETTVFG
jgi:hypothetical protein